MLVSSGDYRNVIGKSSEDVFINDQNPIIWRLIMKAFNVEAVFIDRDGTIGGSDEVLYLGNLNCFHTLKNLWKN